MGPGSEYICYMLNARDLINLSRVDANFFRTLTAQNVSLVWKAVRESEGGVRVDPPGGVPEIVIRNRSLRCRSSFCFTYTSLIVLVLHCKKCRDRLDALPTCLQQMPSVKVCQTVLAALYYILSPILASYTCPKSHNICQKSTLPSQVSFPESIVNPDNFFPLS
ncbi:hypothetical protein EDD85DRAFT_159444 [Armillaria nabsnona]|nr:hypothetical protein EDD85DRAFT_159444 [Armillaria nabsnona]